MEKILTKKKPEKSLLKPLKKTGGRNISGKITVRHRGGGVKRLYRIVDFKMTKMGEKAKVIALEYDPNRTSFIALIEYPTGARSYIIAPQGLKVGREVEFGEKVSLSIGNRMKLKNIPVGTFVYNIEMSPNGGGKIARAAGNSCQVISQEEKYTVLKMPSGEQRRILGNCFASIGVVSNAGHRFQKIGKAGIMRLKGRRPVVRGSAMNPSDHPHGGGEGRSPIGLSHPKTPWGKPALGVKTRKKKKWTNKLIIKRRRKKR